MIRVGSLSEKLQAQMLGGSGNAGNTGRDMVKNSQMVQELLELTEETDLRGIEVVERDLALIPRFSAEIKSQAKEALRKGLRTQNHSLVGNALQAFNTMNCLEGQIKTCLLEYRLEITDKLKNLGRGELKDAGMGDHSQKNQESKGPGRVAMPAIPSSLAVRVSLWNDVQKLTETALSIQSQLDVLASVITKKKDTVTHQLLMDGNSWKVVFAEFWAEMSGCFQKELGDRKGLVRQTLETEYPKLLRQILEICRKIDSHNQETSTNIQTAKAGSLKSADISKGSVSQQLRESLKELEVAYLSKSLSRLFDSVNLSFTDEGPPCDSEIASISDVIHSELQVTAFDKILFLNICHNVAKSVKLFGAKCEQMLFTDPEASQVIGNPNQGQKRNVAVVNAVHRLHSLVLEKCESFAVGENREGSEGVACIAAACGHLLALISSAVQPLLESVDDAIAAIIDTVHGEDFAFAIPGSSDLPADQQCSLYMRELQEFIARVWQDHLAPFACRDFIYEKSAAVARKACRLFLIHTTLVRPVGEGGRLRLAADFAQMELALSPLCRRLSVDLGPDYATLRAIRPLLFQNVNEIAESPAVGKEIPFWLVVQLLISQSSAEIQSPHATAGWSVVRYSEWLEEHPDDSDRFQFLKGTLDAYEKSVEAQGKTEYVGTYPVLAGLLSKAAEHLKAAATS